MKILIVAHEFPYPPNHGGRMDVWNKILSFKQQGHSIMLVTWTEIVKGDVPSNEDLKVVKDTVDELILFPIKRDLIRMLNLIRFPSFVGARILSSIELKKSIELAKQFGPNCVFVEQIYAGRVGLQFAKALGIPCGLRLHNKEFDYMTGQLKLERNFKKRAAIFLACLHLKKFEESIIRSSDAYYDISQKDLAYWKDRGFKNGHWLPPLTLKSPILDTIEENPNYDLCFLGNLNSPNNVDGVTWFINHIYLKVKLRISSLKLLIMGSNPCDAIKDLCSKYGIELISNPIDPAVFQRNSRILVNPVRFGSGVNVKSIDMLFTSNQVVTTSVGIQGLPKSFEETFFICDTDFAFSEAIVDILNEKIVKSTEIRGQLRSYFKPSQVDIVENTLVL